MLSKNSFNFVCSKVCFLLIKWVYLIKSRFNLVTYTHYSLVKENFINKNFIFN